MKTKILIATIILLSGTYLESVYGGELSIDVIQYSALANDSGGQVGPIKSLQGSYTFENNLYLFASYDTAKITYSLDGFSYKIVGVGGGMKHDLSKYINIFGFIGYYNVSNDWGERVSGDQKCGSNEGLCYDFRDRYNSTSSRYHGWAVEDSNTIGGGFGVNMAYPVTDCFNVGVSLSYRHLIFDEVIKGEVSKLHKSYYKLKKQGNPNHYKNGPVNLSGFGVGLNINYLF